jgi:hypothetical protein
MIFAVYERDAWAGVDVFAAYGVVVMPSTPVSKPYTLNHTPHTVDYKP